MHGGIEAQKARKGPKRSEEAGKRQKRMLGGIEAQKARRGPKRSEEAGKR